MDPDWERRLIRDLPSPTEYDVEPEYAQELAGALGAAIAVAADGGHRRLRAMNNSERRAWRVLLGLGARSTELAGKPALDLRRKHEREREHARPLGADWIRLAQLAKRGPRDRACGSARCS